MSRGEQLRADLVERTESAQRFGFRDFARYTAGDERVDAHCEVKPNLVVRFDFDAPATADREAKGTTNARREHRRRQAGCGVFKMPVTVSA